MQVTAALNCSDSQLVSRRAHYIIICEHVFAGLEVFLGDRGGQCYCCLQRMFTKDSERNLFIFFINMNLLVIGIGIGHEKDLIIGYRIGLKIFISCIPSSIVMLWSDENTFYFLCVQKVFSSLHKIQIELLMADGLFWTMFFILLWILTV